jgi:hypothetical protein
MAISCCSRGPRRHQRGFAAHARSSWSCVSHFDARHNAPRGAGSVGVHYVIDGLPFNADWYVYPESQGAWSQTPR